MKITYQHNTAIPPLAWLARVNWLADEMRVAHGEFVETASDYFFEGAWAGSYRERRPDQTEVVFGSGCVVREGEVRFIPSLATTDYLYYRVDEDSITIANSLALLLATSGDLLDPKYARYDAINNSIARGIHVHERVIPTMRGSVRRVLYYNLICRRGEVHEVEKPLPPDFASFGDYKAYIVSSYASLAQNARDPKRRWPLRIYSTQSRGYDSTAVNAIAAPFGLDGVFTVTLGKNDLGAPEINDDGSDIAEVLGIGPIVPIDRHAYRDGFDDEQYYHASISECQDANLRQIGNHVKSPALLLTGSLGEMWYTRTCGREHADCYHDGLARWDLGTHGLTEVRLRAGYVQVAVPYIGARRRDEILTITESEEMRPWRLDSRYDRPIPRRLAEEAGVPRLAFGQVKAGSVVETFPPQSPRNRPLAKRYRRFLVAARVRRSWQVALLGFVQWLNGFLMKTWWKRPYRVLYGPVRIVMRRLNGSFEPPIFWSDLRGRLFCFAVNECAAEYGRALDPAFLSNSPAPAREERRPSNAWK